MTTPGAAGAVQRGARRKGASAGPAPPPGPGNRGPPRGARSLWGARGGRRTRHRRDLGRQARQAVAVRGGRGWRRRRRDRRLGRQVLLQHLSKAGDAVALEAATVGRHLLACERRERRLRAAHAPAAALTDVAAASGPVSGAPAPPPGAGGGPRGSAERARSKPGRPGSRRGRRGRPPRSRQLPPTEGVLPALRPHSTGGKLRPGHGPRARRRRWCFLRFSPQPLTSGL